jgi:hypothetical protein
MISKQDDWNGSTSRFVYPGQRIVRRNRFDPWFSHGHGPGSIFIGHGASGLAYLTFFTSLKDGSFWYWINPNGMTDTIAFATLNSVFNYPVPRYPYIAIGEGFNYIARFGLTNKVAAAGIGAWSDAH